MATINVKDAAGGTVALEKPLAPGRAAAAASRPVALSTEDKASIDAITAKIISAPATEAKQDTANTALAAIKTAVESTTPVSVFGSGDTLAVAAATCTGAADLLLAGAAGRKSALVWSDPANPVAYLGPSGVTTSDGMPIMPGTYLTLPVGNAALYGTTASGTANFRIMTVI